MNNNQGPKPGIKSTEFWATIGISGLPIADQLGFFNKMPITEGGETALWLSAGLIASVYVFTRAWVKVSANKYGVENENANDSSKPSSGV